MLSEADILTACAIASTRSEAESCRPWPDLQRRHRPRSALHAGLARQWVKVTMTLTTPQCPASGLIFEQVHNRLAACRI